MITLSNHIHLYLLVITEPTQIIHPWSTPGTSPPWPIQFTVELPYLNWAALAVLNLPSMTAAMHFYIAMALFVLVCLKLRVINLDML